LSILIPARNEMFLSRTSIFSGFGQEGPASLLNENPIEEIILDEETARPKMQTVKKEINKGSAFKTLGR